MRARSAGLPHLVRRVREADAWRRLLIGLATEALMVLGLAAAAALAVAVAALVSTL